MARRRMGLVVASLTALLVVGLLVRVRATFRGDLRRARERIALGSRIVETPCGPIEYAIAGEGPPVLVVHGAGGGFDQGLELSRTLVQSGFRIIAISRFGYLRAPLPADASPAAQADAHACLLDALKIQRVAVIGASAGAPSSMQFALRHSDRTAALVLLVPAAYPAHVERRLGGAMPKRASAATRFLFDVALKSDFFFWAAVRLAPRTVSRAILGTPPSVVQHASADERARVAEVLDLILPVSPRRLGLLNDAAITPSLPRYELERIAAPTLILGVADDLYGTFDGARYSADHIPHARFVGYPTGGHLWVGHQKEVMTEMTSFLRAQTI